MESLPYLTKDIPGVGGLLKQRVEDFRVEEIPLYEACGEGSHVYFRVEKAGIPTPVAVQRLARYMGVRPDDIGVAGMKDAQAITLQMMSLEHAEPEKLAVYHDPEMHVVWTSRHTNKLRPGHLAGNRFDIRLREVGEKHLARAREILGVLQRRGVPNYFGQQRFGARGDTAVLGEALIREDLKTFIALFLGKSQPGDPPDCKAARDAFDAGYFDRALARWPRHYVNERKALCAYKRKKHAGPAMAAVDKRMRRLYVSAFQSELFNEVLARRIETFDTVLAGDLAQKTDSGGVFLVEDAATEQKRAAAGEISPTGPIVGYRCHLAQGEPGAIEQEILAAHNIRLEDLHKVGSLKVKGARRPLRFVIDSPELSVGRDEHGEFLQLRFTASSGCYATVVLREIMKTE
jgi:tRNA pseudouridine13 synthase